MRPGSLPLSERGELLRYLPEGAISTRNGVVEVAAGDDRRNLPRENIGVLALGKSVTVSGEAACLLAQSGVSLLFMQDSACPALALPMVSGRLASQAMRAFCLQWADEAKRLAAAKSLLTHGMQSSDIHWGVCQWPGRYRDCLSLSDLAGDPSFCARFLGRVASAESFEQLREIEAQWSGALANLLAKILKLPSVRDDMPERDSIFLARVDRAKALSLSLAIGVAAIALRETGLPGDLGVLHDEPHALCREIGVALHEARLLPEVTRNADKWLKEQGGTPAELDALVAQWIDRQAGALLLAAREMAQTLFFEAPKGKRKKGVFPIVKVTA